MNFDDWYAEHGQRLLAIATKQLGDVHAAADVCADTWAKAWQHRERYDSSRGPVDAWLMTILRRTLIDHVRRRRVTLPIDCEPADKPAADRLEISELLRQVDALPAEFREAVRAVYLDDLGQAGGARVLGIPESTLHNRLKRGLAMLRKAAA